MNIKKYLRLMPFSILFLCLFVQGSAFGAGKTPDLIAPGASLEKVQSGFSFTEGPAADTDGNIYFTDIPTEHIFIWNPENGAVTPYRDNTGRANGLMFDAKKRLVVCEMGNNRVTRDDMKGNITVLADNYAGEKLNMPNDLWIDSKGGIYFSDFLLGPGASGAEGLQIYYIPPDGKPLMRVTDDLGAPNGLIGTPDGKTLYVSDNKVRTIWAYTPELDGSLSEKRKFCDQGTDGMALDENGNLYLTGEDGLYIYTATGDLIQKIEVPERPTNMSFGGKDRKTLFITTSQTSIYTLEMTVRGAPTPLDLAGQR